MLSQHGAAIVFNGEIYNYIELASQLSNTTLNTSSDTEVLLRCLEEQGIDSLQKMNGMWGLAYLDPNQGVITLARDRYGKKPLFWYKDQHNFIAASECKAIFHILGENRQLNPDFLYGLMIGKHLPTFNDQSWFYKDIYTVQPGGGVAFDTRTAKLDTFANNTIANDFSVYPIPSVDSIREHVDSAVRLRMRADVPVGVFLSGGIDSGIIAGSLANDQSLKDAATFYTLQVQDQDDTVWAKRLADKLNLRLKEVPLVEDEQEIRSIAENMLLKYEVPFIFGLVGYPAWLICRAMKEDGIRVALDGTGGDEVFSGYPSYYDMAFNNAMRAHKPLTAMRLMREHEKRSGSTSFGKKLNNRFKALRRSAFPKPDYKTIRSMQRASLLSSVTKHAGHDELLELARETCRKDLLFSISEMQKEDLVSRQMPSYLYMTDMSSMMNSIEVRSPLLDHRLAQYVNLDDKHKFSKGFNKHILRQAMPECVPDSFRWRKAKAGFSTGQFASWGPQGEDGFSSMVNESNIIGELFDLKRILEGASTNESTLDPLQKTFLRGICLLERELNLTL